MIDDLKKGVVDVSVTSNTVRGWVFPEPDEGRAIADEFVTAAEAVEQQDTDE